MRIAEVLTRHRNDFSFISECESCGHRHRRGDGYADAALADSQPAVRLAELNAKLTDNERDLLLGRCSGWGSWMFEAGGHLCSLGLGTKRNGSIKFDTPLAKELSEWLASQPSNTQEQG
jgi:hypothetical protein